MASQPDTVNKSHKTNLVDKSSSSTKEPALKFNLEEFREMRELESAGDFIGVQDLKKRVRQRMEGELASSGLTGGKKEMQVKSTTAASTSNADGAKKFPVKNVKNTVVNHKRLETVGSTSSSKKDNMKSNEDKKVIIKKEKPMTTTISKSAGDNLTVNRGSDKEKPKPSASAPKITRGNLISNNKGKQSSVIHQERLTSLTSISKGTSVNLSNNNKGKGKQTASSKDFVYNSSINNGKRSIVNKELEKCVERWKSLREKGGMYRPLESFLPPEISNDKVQMVTVEKIAKEFELKRLRRLLDQDKEKPNGNKRLAQERIEHLNNFGKDYTRLEIAAVRNEKGPKKDQQIRSYIAFLNEKNIIKNKKVTKLDIIEDPNYLKRGFEQFQFQEERIKQNKLQKDLVKKGTSEFNLQFRDKSGQGKHQQQKLKVERKNEKLEGRLSGQKRHQERIAETKKLHEEAQRRRNRIAEDLRPKHNNVQRKIITNRNESSTLKKRTFDERSEPAPSQPQKRRRNVGHGEFDICRLDEETVNQNLRTIVHSLIRPGRPIYGIVDDNDDDDAMEVSGYEVLREEARSSRIARKEDDEEERAEQLRRMKKLKSKKVQR